MDQLQDLLDRNARWADRKVAEDPQFFRRLVGQQNPEYLWIGCADSRVPANEIVDLPPGELFVHRNVANVVAVDDDNCQSVIEFAVRALQVKHIMVVGHYGCSGVRCALENHSVGPCSDAWLEQVKNVRRRHQTLIEAEPDDNRRHTLLCELNVLEQTFNVCHSPAVVAAWRRGQELSVHGWVYRLSDGRVRHLDFSIGGEEGLERLYETALDGIVAIRAQYYSQRSPRD